MKHKNLLKAILILVMVLAQLPWSSRPAQAVTYTVNTTDDVDDGTCNASHCSLREAIYAANNNAGPDTIHFNITGCGGVCTIQPTSALPYLTDDGTAIDGYTQPGALQATDTTSATLRIEIDGSSAGVSARGLRLDSSNNSISGLVINNFEWGGIFITYGASSNTVLGNYIGTDASGTADLGNGSLGVGIRSGAQNNTIGGDTPGARNVISGNDGAGVWLYDSDTMSNTVSGNYIGTDASSTLERGNTYGVIIGGGAQNNIVGPGNVIVYNVYDGVSVHNAGTRGNTITQNSIYSNTMGIDLSAGANGNIAAPIIVTTTVGSVNIVGTACAGCTVEVFENGDTDGEGETYVGDTITDGSGNFTVTVSSLSQPYLTATATDAISGTSEFSDVFTVTVELAPGSGTVFLPIVLKNH